MTRSLTLTEHRLAMADAAAFYRSLGIAKVVLLFGWGCDCPDAELYQDKLIPLAAFAQFVSEAEAANYYRPGKDNLHFKDEAGDSEFLFCHESDIHFLSDRSDLLDAVKERWRSLGFARGPRSS